MGWYRVTVGEREMESLPWSGVRRQCGFGLVALVKRQGTKGSGRGQWMWVGEKTKSSEWGNRHPKYFQGSILGCGGGMRWAGKRDLRLRVYEDRNGRSGPKSVQVPPHPVADATRRHSCRSCKLATRHSSLPEGVSSGSPHATSGVCGINSAGGSREDPNKACRTLRGRVGSRT